MNRLLQQYFESLDTTTISAERQAVLKPLTDYIAAKTKTQQPIKLTFICTHNSRRSHLGQVWAQVAAHYYNIPHVGCFSGGTEATACNPRTIAALERVGLTISRLDDVANPVYEIHFAADAPPVIAFSKIFDQVPNPTEGFAAIMTCDHAEANCPFIAGAEKRLPIMYIDPKVADDTPQETSTYDARCRQIATEMKWVFERIDS